jgi:DNA-binding response OmpR family regulator
MDLHVRRILIVEDEPQLLGLLKAHLEIKMPAVEVEGVGSAEEALVRLQAQEYDLILSDYHLPRMDGVELLRRSQRTHPAAHRVLMTGAPEENLAPTAAHDAGIDRFFVRPLDVKALARTLEGLLPRDKAQ